jgi:hypothetical protein
MTSPTEIDYRTTSHLSYCLQRSCTLVTYAFTKALDRFWWFYDLGFGFRVWKRIRQDVEDFLERCVLCRRGKIQSQMAATFYPLRVPPRPWYTVELDYLTLLRVSYGFDNVPIAIDNLTRIILFLPCTERLITEGNVSFFYMESMDYMDCPECSSVIATRQLVSGFWKTLWRLHGTRFNMSFSRHMETDGLTKLVNNTILQLLRCFRFYDGSDWRTLLPQVEFMYNASLALGIKQ